MRSPFVPWLERALLGLVVFLVVATGVQAATWRHEAYAARQKVCRAELALVRARNPYVERYLIPADACVALEVVK